MKIAVLTDNAPGSKTMAEHGLSLLIEHDKKNYLFDSGQTDLFIKNASIMGINLKSVDQIILSHGHYDHGNGLSFLDGGNLICHPGCFVQRYNKRDHGYNGLKNSEKELAAQFSLRTSKEPVQLDKRIFFLGEIPRKTSFEAKTTPFELGDYTDDFIPDDSAIAMLDHHGLFVVTGCGHSGIVNTLEYAQQVTGEKRIWGVMGGFHLKEDNLQTRETINYFKMKQIMHIYPSHCTALPALVAFNRVFMIKQVKTGEFYNF